MGTVQPLQYHDGTGMYRSVLHWAFSCAKARAMVEQCNLTILGFHVFSNIYIYIVSYSHLHSPLNALHSLLV